MTKAIYRHYSQKGEKDLEFARKLAADLRLLGYRVSADFLTVRAGNLWGDRIREAQNAADIRLVCLSANSFQSNWYKGQVAYILSLKAANDAVKIIPIVVDDQTRTKDIEENEDFSPLANYRSCVQ